MRIARAYLWFCLIASLVFGAAYLFAPALLTGQMGIEHVTSVGLTDLRASYAGYQLGMAVLLAWCLRDVSRYAAGLVAIACVVGGLGLSRLLGLFIEGPSFEMVFATGIELAMTGFAIFALTRVNAEASAGPS